MLELIRRNIGCKTLYAAYMTYLGNKNKFKNWYNRYLDREFDEDNTNKNSGSIILNINLGHKSSLGTKYALNSSSKLTNMANYE